MKMNKLMTKIFWVGFLSLTICSINTVLGQSVMMEQDVNADTITPKFGKNRKNFIGSFIGGGMMFGEATGDTNMMMKAVGSTSFNYGIYYKYKVSNLYSVLLSGIYRTSSFSFETNGNEKYNRLVMNELLAEFANRFNIGKRGDFVGNYFEIGISGDYSISNYNKIKEKGNDTDIYKTQVIKRVNLNYMEKFNYSAHARIGLNRFCVTADYRLSDLVNENAKVDLPPITLGLRFDIGA